MGSYITTNLYDPQALTFDDMRRAKMKYVHPFPEETISGFLNYNLSKDLAEGVSYNEYRDLILSKEPKSAILIMDYMGLELFAKDSFVETNLMLEQNFYRMRWNKFNSIFKNRFNTYITVIKDMGLLDYWKRNIDLYEYGLFKRIKTVDEMKVLRVLTLNFFKYAFIELLFGLSNAILVFAFEVFIK